MDPFMAGFLIFSVLSATTSAVMQHQAAKQQAAAAEANAEYNAELAKVEAEQEALNREASRKEEKLKQRRQLAAMEGQIAKSGLTTAGSPGELLTEQATIDQLNLQRGDQASDVRQKALYNQADMSIIQGNNAASAYNTQATNALIGGAMNIGSSYYGAKYMSSQKKGSSGTSVVSPDVYKTSLVTNKLTLGGSAYRRGK